MAAFNSFGKLLASVGCPLLPSVFDLCPFNFMNASETSWVNRQVYPKNSWEMEEFMRLALFPLLMRLLLRAGPSVKIVLASTIAVHKALLADDGWTCVRLPAELEALLREIGHEDLQLQGAKWNGNAPFGCFALVDPITVRVVYVVSAPAMWLLCYFAGGRIFVDDMLTVFAKRAASLFTRQRVDFDAGLVQDMIELSAGFLRGGFAIKAAWQVYLEGGLAALSENEQRLIVPVIYRGVVCSMAALKTRLGQQLTAEEANVYRHLSLVAEAAALRRKGEHLSEQHKNALRGVDAGGAIVKEAAARRHEGEPLTAKQKSVLKSRDKTGVESAEAAARRRAGEELSDRDKKHLKGGDTAGARKRDAAARRRAGEELSERDKKLLKSGDAMGARIKEAAALRREGKPLPAHLKHVLDGIDKAAAQSAEAAALRREGKPLPAHLKHVLDGVDKAAAQSAEAAALRREGKPLPAYLEHAAAGNDKRKATLRRKGEAHAAPREEAAPDDEAARRESKTAPRGGNAAPRESKTAPRVGKAAPREDVATGKARAPRAAPSADVVHAQRVSRLVHFINEYQREHANDCDVV